MDHESGQIGQERLALDGAVAKPRRGRRIAVIAAVLAVLLGMYVVFGRGGDKPAAERGPGAEQAPPVTVMAPGRQTVDRVITANGSLAARRELPVGVAGEGGRVTRVLVDPGQWVSAGQVLATVDRSVQMQTADSLSAQIRVAQADANLAQAQLTRAQALVANGFVSRADIETRTAARDAAAARVRVAQAQLGQQRASTSRLDIRAPAAGLVLTRQVEPGQIVSAGSGVLFRMAQGGEMEMRAALSEADLAGLRAGARASVTPVGTEAKFAGQVWQVSPVIDPQTRQGVARIALPYNVALRPGGFATAWIVAGASTVPMLPESAVQSDRAGNYVYIVDAGDKAVKRVVRTGGVTDQGVSILDGLTGTERVVVAAGAFLSPGQKVKPLMQVRTGASAPATKAS
ncbi:MAG: efflux transporter periplasmic adaptor subunit [Sphingomonas bacterium]|uniref:efflux RND transporter periplasmic adaptor subunit n=1 Tax=Sphingomonas bacterium TaxID=1895847 RepID=UPI002612495A|nr:efflux RND transporter periplasmic adaptor subunit [Sphingomonas bacterium]MDB5696575.1 efflux transporter periplasmic adaptor subunit [Sphingomonas bacterium]